MLRGQCKFQWKNENQYSIGRPILNLHKIIILRSFVKCGRWVMKVLWGIEIIVCVVR